MLTIKNAKFNLDGKEMSIYSGAIHYFRVLPEYWEDRLTKLKAAGFNTVETYVSWNLHEPKKGEFDFSGMLDLVKFLQIAQKVGLYAIVRPGPYICAEWDFGGFPAWLLKDDNIRLRCMNDIYLKHVKDFYTELLTRLLPMQIHKGGNIIAMQIENEYGSHGSDKQYLRYVKDLMLDLGVEVLLFTSDGSSHFMLSGGTLPDTFKVINFGSNVRGNLASLNGIQDDAPRMCGEFWCGWFDHYGEKHHTRGSLSVVAEIKQFLDMGASFNFYMFHGGTNFNFYAGANYGNKYQPTITSYDYCALLNEYGEYTPAYHAVRELLLKHQNISPDATPLPAPVKLQTIGKVALTQCATLLDNMPALSQKHHSARIESMEKFDQNFGMIVYRKVFDGKYGLISITLEGVHDRAYVYINGKFKKLFDRTKKPLLKAAKETFSFLANINKGDTLEILVDCMGRVNFGRNIMDKKGLANVYANNQTLMEWDVYTLPLDNIDNVTYTTTPPSGTTYPAFFKGHFHAGKEDCFIDIRNFKKGVVYVNGFNLGRYWEIGPQRTLYLPGAILKEENEIVIFEQEGCTAPTVEITDKHILG